MKSKLTLIIASLLATTLAGFAQEAAPDAPRPERPAGERERPAGERARFVHPLLAALDTNKDGELSAEEIANAAVALKALDKDGDGTISREELRPEGRPGGQGGQGGERPRRQRGEGGGARPAPADPAAE